jgi:glycosyltransferase involved in cell wall biosynthesis
MKVMHVITGLGGGGAEGFLVRLLKNTRDVHSAEVVSLMDRGHHGDAIEAMRVPVHTLGLGRGKSNPLALWRLILLIRSKKPDVIVSWMYHSNFLTGLAALMFPRVKLVWTIHHANLDPLLNKRRTLNVARWCRMLSWRCAAIVYVGERSRELHEKLGYSAEGGVAIPIGVDGEAFQPNVIDRERCRREWGFGPDEFVFGLVARLDPLKNVQGFIRAAGLAVRQKTALRLVLAGESLNGTNEELKALIMEYGLEGKVHFLGPRSDVPAIMNGVDAVVLSSVGESFPTVLCEALSCGKPCISTDVGDAAMIVGPHGQIVPPGDDHALAEAMVRLACLSTAGCLARSGEIRARALELFDMCRVATKYKSLLESVRGTKHV